MTTLTILLVIFAVCGIALLIGAVRSRRHPAPSLDVRPLDLQALRTLMDREDELFMRQRLPRGAFFHLKRLRIRVTLRYVWRISRNAAVVLRECGAARQSHDPQVAEAAAQVVDLATQLRLQCLVAYAKFSMEFVFPSMQLTPAMLATKYQTLRENVLLLGSLQPQNVASLASAI